MLFSSLLVGAEVADIDVFFCGDSISCRHCPDDGFKLFFLGFCCNISSYLDLKAGLWKVALNLSRNQVSADD